MKKILMLMVLLNTLCNFYAHGLENAPQSSTNIQNTTSVENKQIPTELRDLKTEIQKLQELVKKENAKGTTIAKSSCILQKINSIFTFVVEKADKLLSKKFLLATLIALAPAIAICSIFFDVSSWFYWVSEKTAEKTTTAGAPIFAGAVTGTANAILNNKVVVAEVVGIWAVINIFTTAMSKLGEQVTPYMIIGLSKGLNFLPVVYNKLKLLHKGQ